MRQKFNIWMDSFPISLEHLALFRIFFAVFLYSFTGFPRFDWIASFPDYFYSPPPSIASFFNDFPGETFFYVMNFLLPLLMILVLVGYKTFWVSVLLGLGFILVFSFEFAFGKINHSHFIPFTLLLFSFSGWGKRFSVDYFLDREKKNKYPAPQKNILPLYALIISFSYFTSGVSKLYGGWLNTDFQAAFGYLIRNYYFTERQSLLSSFALNLKSTFLWEMIDYAVVVIEILPFCFLFNKRVFSISLFLLGLFHFLVFLIFNISFVFYPLLFCVFIINWEKSRSIARLVRFFTGKTKFLSRPVFVVGFVSGLYLFYIILMYSNIGNLGGEYPLGYLLALLFSFIVLLYFCLESVSIYLRERKDSKNHQIV